MESLKKAHYYEHSLDESIVRYLGCSLIYRNTSLSIEDVIKKYFDKDSVERAFKQMKGVLDLRPVRVWLKSHIEDHVKICYLTYVKGRRREYCPSPNDMFIRMEVFDM